jgi:3-deoxy-D-manno-octulosonate 8-phosphate phosphatase (KDO 8-P phosphatase)
MDAELRSRARRIRALVLDVDGVLTDGRLYYGVDGEAIKAFDVRDGFGIRLLQQAGIQLAILSSRRSAAVAARAGELDIELVLQGRTDKLDGLREILAALGVEAGDCAMIGDDWPDLAPLARVGLAATVADAAPEVRERAHWVARACGGRGAVRELAEMLLRAQDRFDALLARAIGAESGSGRHPAAQSHA